MKKINLNSAHYYYVVSVLNEYNLPVTMNLRKKKISQASK
jgi:hypothetical protein